MSTAETRRLRPPGHAPIALGVLLLHLAAAPARSHPISQGRLEVVVGLERVTVRATVSNEEVLVASAAPGRGNASPLETRRRHGDYLLGHLRVAADGVPLAGRVVERPEALAGRPVYVIDFELTVPKPARLVF